MDRIDWEETPESRETALAAMAEHAPATILSLVFDTFHQLTVRAPHHFRMGHEFKLVTNEGWLELYGKLHASQSPFLIARARNVAGGVCGWTIQIHNVMRKVLFNVPDKLEL